MQKGEQTKNGILDVAYAAARRDGLEALTIGALARAVDMSKSGLFAHFRSKTGLQIEVLEHAAVVFIENVVHPSISRPRGEPRLIALFENWLDWARSQKDGGGCIFLAAAAEFDDTEGPVRDALVAAQERWLATLERTVSICIDEKHFHAGVSARALAYRLYANMMAFHFYARLMRAPDAEQLARSAFDALLEECRPVSGEKQ